MPKLSASILSSDFWDLGAFVTELSAAGVQSVHVDVMDGCFVPNISMGPHVARCIHNHSDIPLDVHLMIKSPERFFEEFVAAGASSVTVHCEQTAGLSERVDSIRRLSVGAGLAISPGTDLALLRPYLHVLSRVLVMTVEPGYGGQSFLPSSVGRIATVREMLMEAGSAADLAVDGGININTAPLAVKAGANVLVVGSALTNGEGPLEQRARALRLGPQG